MKFALSLNAITALCLHQMTSSSASPLWLPSAGDGMESACFNQYHGGGTVLAQCGGPTTTQIANNRDSEGKLPIKEFIALTDHSIQLLDHQDVEHPWVSDFSGFGTTNWGGHEAEFKAQAYTSYVGGSTQIFSDCTDCAPKSAMNLGFTSYFMQVDESLGDNQFFVGSPGGVNYYLPGCPNYTPGQTSEGTDFVCPRVEVKAGTYKFTVLGLMSGSMINSLNSASPPATDQGTIDSSNDIEHDIANYKTLLYRTTLDIGAMTDFSAGDLGNFTTLVIGGVENGKSFDQISSTSDLSGSVLQVTGNKFGAINVTFSDRYSTGTFTRSEADVLARFDGCQDLGNNAMDDCTTDVTGFYPAPDSFPNGVENGGNDGVKKSGTPEMSREELGKLDGAPELKVTEVKNMKITMRPSTGCAGRPASPAAMDSTGTKGLSWPEAPDDCPPWYLATSHPGDNWAVEYGDHLKTVKTDDMTLCESGSCYLIDFHIELGGQTEESRTVFGNPANDQDLGWQTGTFFMYDPEVQGEGVEYSEPTDWLEIIVLSAAGFLLIGIVVTCCYCCKKRKSRQQTAEANLTGVQLA
ncbi:hypothetical protein TrST_g12171 [Triparma strigata]|uniref:Uncharacterized protein n=1 Tax=Triparma strigata TaxID=1606541 RepID=A0A9W7B263_9STRA|nr:hypothetical protein TrST_g12171 [Triparma strigata]